MAHPLTSMSLASGNDPIESVYLAASTSSDLKHDSPEVRKAASDARAKARFSLEGKTAVITGGYGALGFECALALLEHGVKNLGIIDLRSDPSKLVALRERGVTAAVLESIVDLGMGDNAKNAVDHLVQAFGCLDIVLCCTGIVGVEHALDITQTQWKRMQDINTTSGFLVAQAAARNMITLAEQDARPSCNGCIIFISSISAHHVNFPQPQVAYNVSKAAVSHMAKCLAAEWAVHGIRVNCISPGYLDTPLNEGVHLDEAKKVWYARTPLGRMGRTSEIAGVVIMLCSPAGSFFVGSDIVVDVTAARSIQLRLFQSATAVDYTFALEKSFDKAIVEA